MGRILLIFISLLGACSWIATYPESPEGVALAYQRALLSRDFEQVRKYCDASAKQFVDFMEKNFDHIVADSIKERQLAEAQLLKLARCTLSRQDSQANCRLCCKPNGDDWEEQLTLIRQNGRWVVWMDKTGSGAGSDE